jgi:hypothetical protein
MLHKATKALEKGTALLLKNKPQASISYFETVIELAPDSYFAYHNIAIAHCRLGLVEDASGNSRSRSSFPRVPLLPLCLACR